MDEKDKLQNTRNIILDTAIEITEAFLRTLHNLRRKPIPKRVRRKVGRSQIDLVEDILIDAGEPLHVTEIIERVHQKCGVQLDRESIVSAVTKKIQRNDRFVRTDKNTFAVKTEDE